MSTTSAMIQDSSALASCQAGGCGSRTPLPGMSRPASVGPAVAAGKSPAVGLGADVGPAVGDGSLGSVGDGVGSGTV
ncbi:MAG TPA: hypothetical protein PLL50_07530 [Propionicimonas sp.]|nr:hypothetical protein [Propionicimonas sp.]HQD97117.1 hypothetical protein [Propionicimonas sp.]